MTGSPSPPASEDRRARARRYLLGQLSNGEREEYELELMSNEDVLEATEAVEESLLLDLARDRLSPAGRQRAEGAFLDESRRREVELTRAILAEARGDSRQAAEPAASPRPWWLRTDLAAAAVAALAVGSTLGWVTRPRFDDRGVVRVDVTPASERGTGGTTDVSISPGSTSVRLRIPLPAGTSADTALRAQVRAGGQSLPIWVTDVLPKEDAGQAVIEVDVPSRLLSPGPYFVVVRSRTDDAAAPVVDTAVLVR